MATKRSRKQIERIKKIRSKAAGRAIVHQSKLGRARSVRVKPGKTVISGSLGSSAHMRPTPSDQEQPRPKIPLLSGGKNPTLAERFEEELYRS